MSRSKYINTFNTTADYEAYIESAYPEFPNVALDKQANKLKIQQTSRNSHIIFGTVVDGTTEMALEFNNLSNYSDRGTSINVHLDTLSNTFYLDTSDLTAAGITSLVGMNYFSEKCTTKVISFKKLNIDTSNVSTMHWTFKDCSLLTSIDCSMFNTSNVTITQDMFRSCSSLTSLDLSTFNTSKLTNSASMFQSCTSLKTLNLSNWNLSNLTSYTGMFFQCYALTDVYINVEATLNKLTNNLSSQGNQYIPSSATIHYDNGSQVIDYKWQNNAWTAQS